MQRRCITFDVEKYCTPLLRELREKGLKRTAREAFMRASDALDDLELAPKIKRPVRRPPPVLTLYVRKENEKAYNAMNLDETTVEALKDAVSEKYDIPSGSIDLKFQNKERSEMLDDEMVKNFNNEDVFIISLDYNKAEGVCCVVFQSTS